MSVFQQLCEPLQKNLINRGWKSLRPIQERAFPEIAAGKNVLLIAPTAGGKTEAAFLPLLNRAYALQGKEAGVKILYIAPLRALLNNIESRCIETKLCGSVYLEAFKWHGDVDRTKKLAAAKSLPDVLLTTPESLDVILCSPYVDKPKFFAPLDAIIVDETHYFAGIDRGGQLVSVMNRTERILDRDVQRICLSATVGNPEQVLAWISLPSKRTQQIVRPPAQEEKAQRDAELNYHDPEDEVSLSSTVVRISTQLPDTKSIIFEPSRRAAEKRSKDFQGPACVCHVHHSSVDKFWREKAEFDLSQAKTATTVIATCTLELGLDVGDLDLIQQEGDFPSVSSYLQRIGRTGRREPPQRCYAHVTDEFDFLKNLAIMTLAEEGYVEDNSLPKNFYHLLLQQLMMLALGNYGFPVREAQGLLRSCSALSDISDAEFDELLTFWISTGVFRVSEGLLLLGPEVERRFGPTNYRDLYVLFDSPQTFEVWHGRTAIGTLDLLFVRAQREKFVFILAGRWWQVKEIRYNEGLVYVEPFLTAPPPATWIAPRGREISYRLAQQIKLLLLSDTFPSYLKQLAARDLLIRLRQTARAEGLSNVQIQFHSRPNNSHEVITYAGDRVNLLVAGLARKLMGWICEDQDVGYAYLRVRVPSEPAERFEISFSRFLDMVRRGNRLQDGQLLTELATPYDDEGDSKWSAWLPPKYRQGFLVGQLYDIPSTLNWLRIVGDQGKSPTR